MRIVMTTDIIGGVWTFTQELSAGLLEAGHYVSLISVGGLPAPRHTYWAMRMQQKWKESFQYSALTTNLEWMQENENAFYGAAQDVFDIAANFRAELLHFNQFCFGALPVDIPKIITVHSDVLSWAKMCRNGEMEESTWLQKYKTCVSAGLIQSDIVIAPTHWMLAAIAENFQLPVRRYVIHNGRTISWKSGTNHKLQAVTAGRIWDEAKNFALLSEVSSPIPLLVAGESVSRYGHPPILGDGARVLGFLGEEDFLDLLRESALYICTSKYEPFGLAALEAALCGCAILAKDIPSMREVWGDAALYFEDALSLTVLIEHLCRNKSLIFAAQTRSRKRAGAYTREKMTASYLEVFSHAVKSKERFPVADVA